LERGPTYNVDLKRSFVPATEQAAEKEEESDSESVWPPELKYFLVEPEIMLLELLQELPIEIEAWLNLN
jgi:hypothetical protein